MTRERLTPRISASAAFELKSTLSACTLAAVATRVLGS
jgi:hypothetical protein